MDAATFLKTWRGLLRERLRDTGTRSAEVAARLHLSESSLRKRLRGEVPFSAEEFVTLCDAFGLPRCPRHLTERWLGFGGLTAVSRALFPEPDAAAPGGLGTPAATPVTLRLCASDLPIHRLLGDPVLAALKLYFFRTDNGVSIEERFDLAAARERLSGVLAQAAEVHARYQAVDSVEVWGRNPMASFLHQIKKLAWAHALNAADLEVVFARLRALTDEIAVEADAGRKRGGGAFELYQNWVFTNNAIFLASAPGQRHTFLTVANPHYLHSDDPSTYAFLSETIEALRQQSERVGSPGVVDGSRLARTFHQEIDRAEEAIKTYRRAEAMF